MKRQRNRGRGGGGSNNGGGKPQHNANRAFDSNGPDNVKVRGAAQHIFERYQQLARDAGSAGDRVLAENYLQHAEHYFRVLRAMQPQRPVSEIMGRDQFVSGYDIDFEDEGQNGDESAEAEADGAADGRRDGQWQRDDRPQQGDRQQQGEYRQRDDRPQQRDDRPQRDDYRPRDDRPQGEYRQDRQQGEYRQRDDRPQNDRQQGDRQQSDRPQGDRQQGDRYQGDRQNQGDRNQGDRQGGRYPRDDRQARYQNDRPQGQQGGRQDRDFPRDRPERDPLGVIEPQATPITAATTAPAPAPTPYEPPRDTGVLRGEDGTMSHAPAFLHSAPRAETTPDANGDEPAEAKRPRRRRAPRTFEPGQAAPVEVDEG